MSSQNMRIAMGCAKRWAEAWSAAEGWQLRNTINEVVGRLVWRKDRWVMVWPTPVCDAAGLEPEHPRRRQYSDESE